MADTHRIAVVISDPRGATLTVDIDLQTPPGVTIQGAVNGFWTAQAQTTRYLRPSDGLDVFDRFGIAWAILLAFGDAVQRAHADWHAGSLVGVVLAFGGAWWMGLLLRAAWRATR